MDLSKIAQVAEAAREYIFGKSDNEMSTPFSINNDLKQSMNIQIFYEKSIPFDGCVKWSKSSECPMFIISMDDSYYRQEFTIAHELGHLLLHWHWIPYHGLSEEAQDIAKRQYNILGVLYRYPNKNDRIEKEANEFSADFLMPANGVRMIYHNSSNKNLDNVKYNVSDRFNVSLDAAFTRLNKLESRGELK